MPPMTLVPLALKVPVQLPVALQDVAPPVELQVSVEVPPLATLVGFAVKLTVGAGSRVTVVVAVELLPPSPVQITE